MGGLGAGGSAEDQSEVSKHIRQLAKESKRDVGEVLAELEISAPKDVEHRVKGRFDAENIRFSGIPKEWKEVAHKQFGVPLASCPRVEVDGYADRIPLILVKLRERL